MKRLLTATVMAVMLVAAPAAAQQYPPSVNSLTVSDTTPTPGQTITIEGRTFAAGADVTVTMSADGQVTLGSATADAVGVAALQATIPPDTKLGTHTITAVGQAPDGAELSLSVSINVVAADGAGDGADRAGTGATGRSDASGQSGSLPRTGSDSSIPLAKLGLALAALGGVVTAVASKRRRAAAAAT